MKLVAEEAIDSPVVKKIELDKPVLPRYDRDLLTKIDAEIISVRNYGLAAVHALSGDNELEFAQRLKHFRLALKKHLKKVGFKLYVFLREELKNDPRAENLSLIEKQVTKELADAANVLASAKGMNWHDRTSMKSELSDALARVMKIHEKEKAFLHPIYAEVASKHQEMSIGRPPLVANA